MPSSRAKNLFGTRSFCESSSAGVGEYASEIAFTGTATAGEPAKMTSLKPVPLDPACALPAEVEPVAVQLEHDVEDSPTTTVEPSGVTAIAPADPVDPPVVPQASCTTDPAFEEVGRVTVLTESPLPDDE
ncbi:MAG: hypothetical protein ACYDEP_06435 [Acidimicrobiales bacterium]